MDKPTLKQIKDNEVSLNSPSTIWDEYWLFENNYQLASFVDAS